MYVALNLNRKHRVETRLTSVFVLPPFAASFTVGQAPACSKSNDLPFKKKCHNCDTKSSLTCTSISSLQVHAINLYKTRLCFPIHPLYLMAITMINLKWSSSGRWLLWPCFAMWPHWHHQSEHFFFLSPAFRSMASRPLLHSHSYHLSLQRFREHWKSWKEKHQTASTKTSQRT